MDIPGILEEIREEVTPLLGQGKVADYIEPLSTVPASRFGFAVQTMTGEEHATGDAEVRFSIQSIAKLFTLAMAFRGTGAAIWKRVGREPSGTPFNSLVQLEYEQGRPRNPFINAGALVIADILLAQSGDPKKGFLAFLGGLSGNPKIGIDKSVYRAELHSGHRNRALANLLKDFGNLDHPVEEVLDFYCFQCAVAMNCRELARAASFLANHGTSLADESILDRRQTKRVNAVMLTCGTYDAAGDFAYRVGLPGKSGVGGGIVAIVPDRMSLCAWSPALNTAGNSYVGTKALELFTTKTHLSIF